MVIRTNELLDAAAMVCEREGFKVTVKKSLAGGLMTGAGATVGSLLLGPVGLFLGGATAGLTSYLAYKDSFKPLAEVIRNDLSPVQRQIFIQKLREAFEDVDAGDLIMLGSLLMSNRPLYNTVVTTIMSFAASELNLQIANQ